MTVKELQRILNKLPANQPLIIEYYYHSRNPKKEELKSMNPDQIVDYGEYTGTLRGFCYIQLKVWDDE